MFASGDVDHLEHSSQRPPESLASINSRSSEASSPSAVRSTHEAKEAEQEDDSVPKGIDITDKERRKRGSADPYRRKVEWAKDVLADDVIASPEIRDLPSQIGRPLSWDEARAILREVLERYMETPVPVVKQERITEGTSRWSAYFRLDLDLYFGALPASMALLVLSIRSFLASKGGDVGPPLNADARQGVYTSQIIASVLLVFGSVLSIFFVRRRRYSCARDSDVSKRGTIIRFLSASDKHDHEVNPMENQHHRVTSNPQMTKKQSSPLHLSGTSLADIYPVYRWSGEHTSSWHRSPTLLLVKGDYIALQIGDVAPAECKLIDASGRTHPPLRIHAGDRVSSDLFGDAKTSAAFFARGKSTVPSQSRELLTLCNKMRVFILEETPLQSFLRLPHVKRRDPQVHRQLRAIREAMFMFGATIFVSTAVIVFVRPDVTSTDLSILLHVPFLAFLGVLPVTTPACAFFLEIMGTARILVAVHPHANTRSSDGSYSEWSLFIRYALATITSRLSLQQPARKVRNMYRAMVRFRAQSDDEVGIASSRLLHVPPASTFLLEKLGVTNVFALVDDELACEPYSTPQQLLIPSGKGLKLLDLCPTYETDSDEDSDAERTRKRGKASGSSHHDSESDSDDEPGSQNASSARRKLRPFRRRRKRKEGSPSLEFFEGIRETKSADDTDVQFEDPRWWQHLPSLKCIGLACLVVDDHAANSLMIDETTASFPKVDTGTVQTSERTNGQQTSPSLSHVAAAEAELVRHISSERRRRQLRALARCIGFSTEKNSFGEKGDLSMFKERLRLHILSTKLLSERIEIDTHALGLEESRSWGLLRPDSTSVIVQDRRSKAYQLLTVGDPRIVTDLCHEAWQGENSTILPLNASDRNIITDTSTNWRLADLDVTAFSYSPVPHTLEKRLGSGNQISRTETVTYLIDNAVLQGSKDSTSEDWTLVANQIFLGVLGSSVIPRKEVKKLLDVLFDEGVRFVYFSPRNMRRTKELASQMGIDIAWNCAISLRALGEGEEDPYRMVSTYADWSVNAKLPHGIENVRKHLVEVDNVPLLVSLFTDATKESSQEMVKIYQDYTDTVVAMGLSHLARNANIFSAADISIGADILGEELAVVPLSERKVHAPDFVLPHEMVFVSAISAHSCAFSLGGAASSAHMPDIIASGRTSLDAAVSAATFIIFGCVTFSLYVLLCMCAASTIIPFVPTLGSVLYLQITLPMIGLAMVMSAPSDRRSVRAPPKNDPSVTFGRKEGSRMYKNILLKALLPAILPQILHLIALGELMIKLEPELVANECNVSPHDIESGMWASVIRCDALKDYSGDVRISAGALVLAEYVLCVIVTSASFVHGTTAVMEEPPWVRNRSWLFSTVVSMGLVVAYLFVALQPGTISALPWYFFVLAIVMPCLCLSGNEAIKRTEIVHAKRAVNLRRLLFETRLGMWSPK